MERRIVKEDSDKLARTYQLKRRAESQAETRQRIVAAAVELHTTVGPLRTTDSAIAQKAGVTRVTFYRHFPDTASLFRACTLHGLATWPPPDPRAWRKIRDPMDRLRVGLTELYEYYGVAGEGLVAIARDAPLLPSELLSSPNRIEALQSMGAVLARGWSGRGRRRAVVRAAIDHAIAVTTWQTLVQRGGLRNEEAVALLVALVEAASD